MRVDEEDLRLVAAVEELEHGGHVRRPLDVMDDLLGLGRRIGGRLGIPVLNELVVLQMREWQLGDAAVWSKDAELEILVPHERGAVGAPFDFHTGPQLELIGDLGYELGRMGHADGTALTASLCEEGRLI